MCRRTRRILGRSRVLEGRVVIGDCGCWRIKSYSGLVLRFQACPRHVSLALDKMEEMLYLDKVSSVSAPDEDEEQLWLT